jgi:hypothetical protein
MYNIHNDCVGTKQKKRSEFLAHFKNLDKRKSPAFRPRKVESRAKSEDCSSNSHKLL